MPKMMAATFTVEDCHRRGRGTRGGKYHYLWRGDRLVHVSESAAAKRDTEDGVAYDVPESLVDEFWLLEFYFSNSGILSIDRLHPRLGDQWNRVQSVAVEDLRGARFVFESPALEAEAESIRDQVARMAQELDAYYKVHGLRVSYGGQRQLERALAKPREWYYAACALPQDRGRLQSLRLARKAIHQLWVLMHVARCYGTTAFRRESGGDTYWWLEQGEPRPTTVAEAPQGPLSLWCEPQITKGAHLAGMFSEGRFSIRPDLASARGEFTTLEEAARSGLDLVIECKDDVPESWNQRKTSSLWQQQIKDYRARYPARLFLLCSYHAVPDSIRQEAIPLGATVVDDLRPGGAGEGTLHDLIRPPASAKI